MLSGLFLIIQFLFAIYLIYYIVAFLSGAPFVPSTHPTADSMMHVAHIKRNMICYDLGSGEGKLLKRIAAHNAQAIGIEINPLLVLYSKIRFYFSPRISVRWQSFWITNLSDADIIFVYLLPLRMEKLKTKLMRECKKGTLIVSNSFIFPDWEILRQDVKNHVYAFRI